MISQQQIPKEEKTPTIISPTVKTKITGTRNHWSLISLHINGLNSLINRHRLTYWIQEQNPSFCCIQEIHLNLKDRQCFTVKGWRKFFNPIDLRNKLV